MSIFKSAYDTLGASYYRDIARIKEHVFTAYSYGDLYKVKPGVYCVTNRGDRSGSIPVFNYPLVFHGNKSIVTEAGGQPIGPAGSEDNIYGDAFVVFDARPYLTTIRTHMDEVGGRLNIRDQPKFQAQVLLAQMALMWDQGDVNKIRDIADLPFAVFAWWLSETIGKRYALANDNQVDICALAAIWFQSNFTNRGKGDVDEMYKAELISVITRVVGIRIPHLEDIVEKYPVITQTSDFILAVKDWTDSRKLDGLNESVFTSAIGGSWYGPVGREQIVVACEYPPQWITMVMQSLVDRGYKQAPLTRITERNTFKRMQPAFARSVGNLAEYSLD